MKLVHTIMMLPATFSWVRGVPNRRELRPTRTARVAELERFLISTSAYLQAQWQTNGRGAVWG